MTDHQQAGSPEANPSLLAGLIGVAKNMFGLLLNRIELAALEVSEIRNNLLKFLLAFAFGMIVVGFAIAYWTVLVVFLAWDTWGWKILLFMAVAFSVLSVGIVLYARSLLSDGKLSMPVTMAELRSDRDALL